MQSDESMEFVDLKCIDMSAPKEEITQQIIEQMTNLGFLAISNVPDYDEKLLFEHQKWFFS